MQYKEGNSDTVLGIAASAGVSLIAHSVCRGDQSCSPRPLSLVEAMRELGRSGGLSTVSSAAMREKIMPLGRDRADAGVALRRRPDSPVMNRSTTEASSSLAIVIEYVRELRVAFIGVLVTLIVAPFAMLPYLADDTINRTNGAFSWSANFHGLIKLQRDWIRDEWRFFPGGSIYALPMWHLLDTRAAYLTYLALLSLACFALVAFVCFRVTRSVDITAIAVIALGACMQIRWWWFDGLSGYAGLIPYTIVLTVLSGLGVAQYLRTGRRWWLIPTALAWTLVITSY